MSAPISLYRYLFPDATSTSVATVSDDLSATIPEEMSLETPPTPTLQDDHVKEGADVADGDIGFGFALVSFDVPPLGVASTFSTTPTSTLQIPDGTAESESKRVKSVMAEMTPTTDECATVPVAAEAQISRIHPTSIPLLSTPSIETVIRDLATEARDADALRLCREFERTQNELKETLDLVQTQQQAICKSERELERSEREIVKIKEESVSTVHKLMCERQHGEAEMRRTFESERMTLHLRLEAERDRLALEVEHNRRVVADRHVERQQADEARRLQTIRDNEARAIERERDDADRERRALELEAAMAKTYEIEQKREAQYALTMQAREQTAEAENKLVAERQLRDDDAKRATEILEKMYAVVRDRDDQLENIVIPKQDEWIIAIQNSRVATSGLLGGLDDIKTRWLAFRNYHCLHVTPTPTTDIALSAAVITTTATSTADDSKRRDVNRVNTATKTTTDLSEMNTFIDALDTLVPMSHAFHALMYHCTANAKSARPAFAISSLREAQRRATLYRNQLTLVKKAYDALAAVLDVRLPEIRVELKAARSSRNGAIGMVTTLSVAAGIAVFIAGAIAAPAIVTAIGAVAVVGAIFAAALVFFGIDLHRKQNVLEKTAHKLAGFAQWTSQFTDTLNQLDVIRASMQRLHKQAASAITEIARDSTTVATAQAEVVAVESHLTQLHRQHGALQTLASTAVAIGPVF
jgi:hypothetical protein